MYKPEDIVCSLKNSENPEISHHLLQTQGFHVSISTQYLEDNEVKTFKC